METKELREKYEKINQEIISDLIDQLADAMLEDRKEEKKEKNQVLVKMSDLYKQIQVMALAAALWNQGEREERIKKDFLNAYDLERFLVRRSGKYFKKYTDITPEYKGILELLEGRECAQMSLQEGERWYLDQKNKKFHVDFFINEAILIAYGFCEDGLQEIADGMVDRLADFAFEGYLSKSGEIEYAKALAALRSAYYYAEQEKVDQAYHLFLKRRHLMRHLNDDDYVELCFYLMNAFAVSNPEYARIPAEEAYGMLQSQRGEMEPLKRWLIEYNYIFFHMKEQIEAWQFAKLRDILEEMCGSGLFGNGDVDLLAMRCAYLMLWGEKNWNSEYVKYARMFYDLSLKYDVQTRKDKAINHKVAVHLLAFAYISLGQPLAAEGYLKAMADHLDLYSNKEVDFYILTNLSMVYLLQNNLTEGKKVGRNLYNRIISGEFTDLIGQNDIQGAIVRFASFYFGEGHFNYAVKFVKNALDQGVIYFTEDSENIIEIYNILITGTLFCNGKLTREEQERFRIYLSEVEESTLYQKLRALMRAEFLLCKARLYLQWGDQTVLYFLVQNIAAFKAGMKNWEMQGYCEFLSNAGMLCMDNGMYKEAVQLMEELNQLTIKELGKSLAYQNRNRLQAYMRRSVIQFYLIYDVLAQGVSAEALYEVLVNHKDVLSLIVSYQRYFAEQSKLEGGLTEEIDALMDLISIEQVNIQFGKASDRIEELQRQLEEKEFAFARKFQNTYEFQPYRTGEIMEAIPDNSAFLEYIVYEEGFYKTGLGRKYMERESRAEQVCMDVFCFVKKQGCCSISRIPLKRRLELDEIWEKYEARLNQGIYRELTRQQTALYEILIRPIEGMLQGVDNLYIAPDQDLNNLPFDVLMDGQGMMLGDRFHIVIVNTGRDFLNISEETYGAHVVVVGNPLYDYTKDDGRRIGLRKAFYRKIKQLPMSEIEAKIIADMLGTKAYTGRKADKSVINQLSEARFGHIATHGICDEETIDGWYSSALLFAGAENWRSTGKVDRTYGNGIVTADEISRMDLSHTELIVLSACYAGRIQSDNGMAGIRSAFRAAGVKYTISPLWEVDDLAGALLMVRFYQYLGEYSIPVALQKAKQYLKNITIEEVEHFKKTHSPNYQLNQQPGVRELDERLKKAKEKRSDGGGSWKPYEDPFYWGAFICEQNTF